MQHQLINHFISQELFLGSLQGHLYKLLKTLARRKVECVALEALMVPQKEVMGSRRRTYCAASCRDSICFRIGIEMLRQDAYHHQNQYHNPETRKISLDWSSSQGSESVCCAHSMLIQ